MSIFIIKIIACITMVFDHIKYAIPELNSSVTVFIGRISFPLYAFLLTEGFVHTSNLKSYIKRLFIFALISQVPFMLFRTLVGEWKMLDIMFTLLLGLFAIISYEKINKKYISIPICILLIILGDVLKVDYTWFGVTLILLLYIFKDKKVLLSIAYIFLVLIYLFTYKLKISSIIFYATSYIVPLIIILLYNGKLGRKLKYFYYWFYPTHMLFFYLINYFFYK